METLIFGPKLSPQEINSGADIISSYQSPSSTSTSNISLKYTNSIKQCAGIGRVNEGIFANIDINIIKNHYHVMNLPSLPLQSTLLNHNYIIYHHECKSLGIPLGHCNNHSHITNSQTLTQQPIHP
jgi:hypothetical protein